LKGYLFSSGAGCKDYTWDRTKHMQERCPTLPVTASFYELVREIHDVPVGDYTGKPVIVVDNREGTETIP
jgi:hypothetical protein